MKPIRWSDYATRKATKRQIDRAEAESAVQHPGAVIAARANRKFYQRRYLDRQYNQEMLMRVLIEEMESELVVVTLYRTSKVRKYLRGE